MYYVCKSVVSLCGCSLDPVHVRISSSICVGVSGIVWPLGARGGGVLWLVGFQKRVKDLVGGDSHHLGGGCLCIQRRCRSVL
jgi:hypothetical protein